MLMVKPWIQFPGVNQGSSSAGPIGMTKNTVGVNGIDPVRQEPTKTAPKSQERHFKGDLETIDRKQ